MPRLEFVWAVAVGITECQRRIGTAAMANVGLWCASVVLPCGRSLLQSRSRTAAARLEFGASPVRISRDARRVLSSSLSPGMAQ